MEVSLRVLVLGGDGFCGWPSALHLSERGHDVFIVDNFARRNADVELEAESLTPIAPLGARLPRGGQDPYSVSVTWSSQVTTWPWSSASWMAT